MADHPTKMERSLQKTILIACLTLACAGVAAAEPEATRKPKEVRERAAVAACKEARGKPYSHTERGCLYVTCAFKDSYKTHATLVDKPKGAKCAPGFERHSGGEQHR